MASRTGAAGPSRRLVASLLLGTLLNPLNSSLIAVALVPIHDAFHVGLTHATWAVSSFYLAGAVGQPLMGQLADRVGPRWVFLVGVSLAGVASGLACLSPSFAWLIAFRVVQALGTSSAYPAALGLFRAQTPGGRVPAAALAALAVANSISAGLGPTLGGFLLGLAGWRAIFLVNLPITATALVLGLLWLPAGRPSDSPGTSLRGAHEHGRIDLAGVLLFAATLVTLLAFLLSLGSAPLWPLLAAVPASMGLLVWWELRAASPFFDLRLLAANRALVAVFVQFTAVNLVFYSIFYGVPIWLEQVRGFDARTSGLLLLPITGLGVLATPAAARLITRAGWRPSLTIGYTLMLAGSLLILTYGPGSMPVAILAVGLVLGIPNGFNNLGLQAALYEAAPPERMSWAGGQLQTSRYVGAILSTSLLAIFFGGRATTAGLHGVAVVIAVISAALLVVSRRR